jgi:carboxymethylenebutenolidase
MRVSVGFGLTAAVLVALAASARGDVKTQDVTIKSGDEEIKGFLAEPDGKGPYPAVVVIQEWWGLTDWIKDNAKRLAAQGYVCLAPDLYRGKVADTPPVAMQLMKGLPPDRAVRDLKAAAATLAQRDNVRKDRIGSIGWCMGGGLSLQLALHDPNIKACVICYGRLVTDPSKLEPLNAPVLGIFGGKDRGIPPKSVHDFEAAMKEAGKKVEHAYIYEDSGHCYKRPAPNPSYKEQDAKDAWQRIEQFFAKTLGEK